MALEILGLRTYASDDVSFYLPEFQIPSIRAADMPVPLRACGVDAFIVEPYLEVTKKLLQVSPGTKVVLMMREWEDWTRAWKHQASCMIPYIAAQIMAGYAFCHWLPHGLAWPAFDRSRSSVRAGFTSLFLENCLLYTGMWKTHHDISPSWEPPLKHEMLRNRTAHEEYATLVRRLVPRGDLLEFDVRQHSWAELAGFLGRAPPSGAAFPRIRTRGFCTAFLARWQVAPARHAAFWALMLASAALNWAAFRRGARLARPALARRLCGRPRPKAS